eukprot:gene4123-8196_t
MTDTSSHLVALYANLSISITSETRLFDAIQNSLSWDYGDLDPSIKTVILRSPTEAIVYIDNPIVVDKLVSQMMVTLSGPLTATFSFADNLATEVISVAFAVDSVPKLLEEIFRTARESAGPDSNVAIFSNQGGALVKLNSIALVSTVLPAIERIPGVILAKNVNVGEHCCLNCSWRGQFPLNEISQRLIKTGQSLTSLVQHCVSLWTEQPLILAVRELPNTIISNSISIDLILICCTSNDTKILFKNDTIELPNNIGTIIIQNNQISTYSSTSSDDITDKDRSDDSQLIYLQKSSSISSNYLSVKHDCILLWDIDTCPPYTYNNTDDSSMYDDVNILLSNIESIIAEYTSSTYGDLLTTPITTLLFHSYDFETETESKLTSTQLEDLHQLQCKFVNYNMKHGIDIGMRNEIDILISKYFNIHKKPIICLIMGSEHSTSTLATLRLSGFDVVVIYNNLNKDSLLNVPSISWQNIRFYHNYTNERKYQILQTLFDRIMLLTNSSYENTNIISNQYDLLSSNNDISQNISLPLSIKTLNINTDLKSKHVIFHSENSNSTIDSTLTSTSGGKSDSITTSSTPSTSTTKEKEVKKMTTKDKETSKYVTETIDLQKYSIANHFKNLELCEHREAAMSSAPFIALQYKYKATVIFHITDNIVLAEIVSLTNSSHNELFKILEHLNLREEIWTISNNIFKEYKDKQWNNLRSKYAVRVDRGNKTSHQNKYSIKVWGFGMLIEQAYHVLNNEISLLSPSSELDLLITTNISDNIGVNMSNKIMKIFHFSNKDYSTYFHTFREEYKEYIFKTFNVEVQSIMEFTPDSSASTSTSTSTGASTSIYIEVSGCSYAVSSVIQYLDKLQSSLSKRSIFFPKATIDKYKSLIAMKSSCELTLTNMRNNDVCGATTTNTTPTSSESKGGNTTALSTSSTSTSSTSTSTAVKIENVYSGGSSSSSISNPMDMEGLMSIRLRPPVHCRGIKRMTFPADVTINLCTITTSTKQKEFLKSIEDRFTALTTLNSEVATAEIEISSHSVLGRKLSSRISRDEIISQYGLIGLHWEHIEGEHTGKLKLWANKSSVLETILITLSNEQSQQHSQSQSVKRTSSHGFHPIESSLPSTTSSSHLSATPTTTTTAAASSSASIAVTDKDREMRSNKDYDSNSIDKNDFAEGVIHWPQTAFRYLFLSETLKKGLNDLLDHLRVSYGTIIRITCPYRDKKDPTVCMLLEGRRHEVQIGQSQINSYLQSINSRLVIIGIKFSYKQIQILTSDDLSHVKRIQGSAGVHLVLDPTSLELSQIVAKHDMRLLSSGPSSSSTSTSQYLMTDHQDADLILVSVPTPNHHHQVEVGVAYTYADSPGWTWGVSSLLVILEADADIGLSAEDLDDLNKGNVLATIDPISGKTVLRVRIINTNTNINMNSSNNNNNNNNHAWYDEINNHQHSSNIPTTMANIIRERQELADALHRGIAQADRMKISGLAIVAPIGLVSLPNLSEDDVRTGLIESVISYITKNSIYTLNRIICLEFLQQVQLSLKSAIIPSGNSKLIATVFSVLDHNPSISLIQSKVPIPPSIKYSIYTSSISTSSITENINKKDVYDEKIVILRGLDESLIQSLYDIKDLLLGKKKTNMDVL